ncbi:MAG: Gfo/Idh/MocA family oxidoreductase [Candidatus Hydrogenedentota bacterium]
MKTEITRRAFLAATTTTAATLAYPIRVNAAKVVPRKISPNEKLNIASVGAGGKAKHDINSCRKENIVALCDVDYRNAAETFERFPDVPKFKDYRKMLEKMTDQIDAVIVTTPDHTHAPAAYMAMKLGKHVYVQKPLTHTVAEARLLTNTAAEMGVATQMGNQGHSGNGIREQCEMVWSGAIGQVRSAHVWTNRPSWPQGIDHALTGQDVPPEVDWDKWLGTAANRPYNKDYIPFKWRGWQDFGGGALGDMACHIMDNPFASLKLNEADWYTVETIAIDGKNDYTYPKASTIKYSYSARGDMAPVDVYWYDGGHMPPRPEGVPDDQQIGEGEWNGRTNGSYLQGDDGVITAGEYGGKPRLLPDERMAEYTKPDPTIARIRAQNHYRDWIEACKGVRPACSNFSYSGPFTEMVLFGNLTIKTGEKYTWDNKKGEVKNHPNPKQAVSKEYRKGWELPI